MITINQRSSIVNEKQALAKGYHFTGIYSSHDKEGVKDHIAKLKNQFSKAKIILVNASNGFAGYADDTYSIYQTIMSLENRIKNSTEEIRQYQEIIIEKQEKQKSDIESLKKAQQLLEQR